MAVTGIWTKFDTELKHQINYQHAGMCQINITWKSKMVATAVLNFEKCQYLRILRQYNLHQVSWEDATRPEYKPEINRRRVTS